MAYADFVTALMALFIVLWMMNASGRVRASVQGYFRDPRGYTHKLTSATSNANEGLALDRKNVRNVQDQIETAIRNMPEFREIQNNVLFSVTAEGLRIDLVEDEQGLFFISGNPTPTTSGEHLLDVLAQQLGNMPNQLVIEGHTDARPFRNATLVSGYSNWELAADRANSARRILQASGLRPEQVAEMRGFADQRLLNPKDPNNPRNRRISVVVKFSSSPRPE